MFMHSRMRASVSRKHRKDAMKKRTKTEPDGKVCFKAEEAELGKQLGDISRSEHLSSLPVTTELSCESGSPQAAGLRLFGSLWTTM